MDDDQYKKLAEKLVNAIEELIDAIFCGRNSINPHLHAKIDYMKQ